MILFGICIFVLLLEAGLGAGGFIVTSLQERRNKASMRSPGAYRILCLGESTTAGGKDSYPAYLEEVLNSRGTGIRFSVINKGRVGITSDYILAQLQENLDTYDPDMVIVMMGINDYGEILYFKDIPNTLSWLFRYSKVYRFFRLLAVHLSKKFGRQGLDSTVAMPDATTDRQENTDWPYKEMESDREYLELGLIFRSEGKFPLAQEACERCLALNPANDRCAVVIGQCLRLEGKRGAAQEMFRKVLALNPANEWGYHGLGACYKEEGLFDQAEAMFKKTLEINPENHNAYFDLGEIYAERGLYPQAEEFLKKALDIDPSFHYACSVLAKIYVRQELYAEAERMLSHAMRVRPGDVNVYTEFGQFCQSLGRYREAEEAYMQSMKIDPGYNWSYVHLGQLYEMQKRYPEAAAVYQKALEVNPANDRVAGAYALLHKNHGNEFALRGSKQTKAHQAGDYVSVPLRNNYLSLRRALEERKITLVCMQYPMRTVAQIRRIFAGEDDGIIFVENKDNFKTAVRKDGYSAYFSDMFGGDFGHCTPRGNRLLAENAADAVIKYVSTRCR